MKKKKMALDKQIVLVFLAGCVVLALAIWFTKEPLTVDNTPVEEFDISLYVGEWYEVARLEQTFEKGCECVIANYSYFSPNIDNIVNVENYCRKENGDERKIEGTARVTDTTGVLMVNFRIFDRYRNVISFPGVIGSDYRVLYVDEDYEYAVVGGNKDGVLWILTKKENPNQQTIDELVEFAEERGYAVEELIYPMGCN